MEPEKEKKQFLGEFEELVLLAVARLGENAYGVPIWEALEKASHRSVALGSIYVTLERLEKKGYVSSRLGEATSERGGKAKRYFKVESAGQAALNEMDTIRTTLRTGALQPV
jgi:PadR family transcriptional regulator PadR